MWVAITALLIWAVIYGLKCWARPFAPCRRCAGVGKTVRFGKTKTCRRCHGKKLRVRVGRRAHNAWRRTHDAGVRPTPARFRPGR